MNKALLIFCAANLLLVVASSAETIEEYREEKSAASAAASASSSSNTKSDETIEENSEEKSAASASASADSSSNSKSDETIEEYREEKSAASAAASAGSSSSTKSDGKNTENTSSSYANAQANANSSVVEYSRRKGRCRKNERWVDCPITLCVPFTCDQLGMPISCPRIIPGRCPIKPACVCINDYVRNKNGVCIPKKKCPSCRGDTNAEAGCGVLCGERCDKRIPPVKPCPCAVNGCRCKRGYIYDDISEKCVLPNMCSNLCPKPNQVFDKCPLSCPPRQCGTNDAAVLCAPNLPCQPAGCRCQNGFYDNDNNECVRFEDCPKNTTEPEHPCPRNEVFDKCPLGCPPRKCGTNDAAVSCQANLPCLSAGCRCQDGFYRNDKNECVKFEDCPKNTTEQEHPCPRNEVFDKCPLACPPRKCGTNDAAVLCEANLPCLSAGCRCQDGFYRNDKNECVKFEDCPPTKPSTEVPPGSCSENADELFKIGNAEFTGSFLNTAYQITPTKNLIMSPYSSLVLIGLLGNFSRGNTQKQFLDTLNFNSVNDIECVFPPLLQSMNAAENITLNLENGVFVGNGYELTDRFKETTKRVFFAKTENLDFGNPEASAERINEWVANATRDRIQDIASPNMFSGDTRLVLVNAIYLKADWAKPFNANDTKDRDFHVSKDVTKKIKMMYQYGTFKYAENTEYKCKILEKEYADNRFTFVVLLPNDIDGLPNLIDSLRDPNVFYKLYGSTSPQKVHFYLPKFITESKFDLGHIMQKAGMTDVFNPSKSQLTDILKPDETLIVSSATHMARIEVGEEGVVAAAANIIVVGVTSVAISEFYEVNVNRPAVYAICFNGKPIFIGTIVTPDEN